MDVYSIGKSIVWSYKGQRTRYFISTLETNFIRVSKHFLMKINRAIGLLFFIACAQFILSDVARSISGAIVATMGLLETTSEASAARVRER